jgi:hypothetical protein
MKRLISVAVLVGVIAAPSLAFARTGANYAPGSDYGSMHGSHDKGSAVRYNRRAVHGRNRAPHPGNHQIYRQ